MTKTTRLACQKFQQDLFKKEIVFKEVQYSIELNGEYLPMCMAYFITPNCFIVQSNNLNPETINLGKDKLELCVFKDRIIPINISEMLDFAVDSLYLDGSPIFTFVFLKIPLCTHFKNKQVLCHQNNYFKTNSRFFIDKTTGDEEIGSNTYGTKCNLPIVVAKIENGKYKDQLKEEEANHCPNCGYCKKTEMTDCDDCYADKYFGVMCNYYWMTHIAMSLYQSHGDTSKLFTICNAIDGNKLMVTN